MANTSTPSTHLARLIAEEGPCSIATLMEVALAGAEGYYAARPAIGEAGDFVTAPEVSQLFGEMLGVFVLQSWLDLGAPADWHLIELGPGRGTLMADLLRVLKLRPQALAGVQVHLVETSPRLRDDQARAVAQSGVEPHWHARFAEVPAGPFILVANEFFDALPIRQFLRAEGRWCERRVALTAGANIEAPRFHFVAGPTLFDVDAEIADARGKSDGEVVEISLAGRAIAAEIGARLARDAGRALIIDYGYAGETHGDTLQALRRHEKVDPLSEIGFADLTAHVDFAALAAAARASGGAAFGPVSQGAFLKAMGIEARHQALAARADERQRAILQRGLIRLTAPKEMGDLFRVIALSSPRLPAPPGLDTAADRQ